MPLRMHHTKRHLKAQKNGAFDNQIVPITIDETYIDDNGKKATRTYTVDRDEGSKSGYKS